MATTTTSSARTHRGDDGDVDEKDERALEARVARGEVEAQHNAREYAEYGSRASQRAVRAGVRSLNDMLVAFVPRALFRPGMVIRANLDLWSGLIDFQRAMWDEMTQVWREDTRAVSRRVADDERVERDLDREWERERDRIGR